MIVLNTFTILYNRKQRQSSKYYVGESKIMPPPVSYTKDEDTGYDEVKGINLIHKSLYSLFLNY